MIQRIPKMLFVLIQLIFFQTAVGQSQPKVKTYNQTDFEKNKVFNETYSFWNQDKLNWFSSSNESSKISYFVDARKYKGIVNYSVTFRSKNYKTFHFVENLSMCFLKIEITASTYNPKDSIAEIEGFVSGNDDWGSNVFVHTKKTKSYVELFLGEKKDTIKMCYLGTIANRDSVEVKRYNKATNAFTVLDTFPAFYFKKHTHEKIPLGNKQYFKIKGKVTPNTLLAFGSSYSDVFDLGSMIYNPEKNKRKTIPKREDFTCKPLITNNKLIADLEKEKAQKQEITYYTYTQNAENYILTRQYAKAKEQYNLLRQNYPKIYARDIHNAARCAILSRDFKAAFEWSEKLALKGIELPYFNAKIFNGLRKNAEWKSFSIKYDSICKIAQKNWNLKLKQELADLLKEDQTDYGLENRKSPKILYETTERVTVKLIDLLKREGFPSEEKIGSFVKNDTVLISFPDFNVLIRHAVQQKPENLEILNNLLNKSSIAYEYDGKRSFNNDNEYQSCFRIYKGNLYSLKSCGRNDLEVRKISFRFSNPNGFIMDYGNFIIEAYDAKNSKKADEDYAQNYTLIMKLTDDWEFYDR